MNLARAGAFAIASVIAIAVASASERLPAAAATVLNYVALGDSITYTGVTASNGWVNLYASDLGSALHMSTPVTNLGIPRATSDQILASVQPRLVREFSDRES